MLCVAKGLLHVAKVLLYAAKVLLCNAKVLRYAAGVAPGKTWSNLSFFFIFSNVTGRFRQHHLTFHLSWLKSFLDRNPFLPGILSCPESFLAPKTLLSETPPFSILLFFYRKHPIKYTLYFHKIENSISTLVKRRLTPWVIYHWKPATVSSLGIISKQRSRMLI